MFLKLLNIFLVVVVNKPGAYRGVACMAGNGQEKGHPYFKCMDK